MDDLARVTANLRIDFLKIASLEQERSEVNNSDRPAAMKDEDARQLEQEISRRTERIRRQLDAFAHFPPWHVRHVQVIEEFAKKGSYERSVFIMTKYPDPKKPAVTDPQLNAVIQTVAAAVTAQQHVPRIASDKDYHSKIWDNVELHMLGCRRAIAIVQDKVKKEFNPNVAIEWGWMLALNRPVLYLVERKFKQQRADWQGMTEYEFDWADPAPGVDAAVAKFLAGGS